MAVDYKVDGRIATITLNRPEAYNSIDIKTFQELHDALVAFRDNEEVWVGNPDRRRGKVILQRRGYYRNAAFFESQCAYILGNTGDSLTRDGAL